MEDMKKIFKCAICHKEIKRNNRLLHQKYDGKETYGKFNNVKNYDFCDKCFKSFQCWIYKHKSK